MDAKVLAKLSDTTFMNISGVDYSDSMISMATDMKAGDLSLQFAVAILRQSQRQQEVQAEGLLKMIRSSTASLEGTGQLVNISA